MNMTKKATIRTILFDAQNGRCCYCGDRMYATTANRKKTCRKHGISVAAFRRRLVTIEHLKRRADGGTDSRDNLALACQECNTTRGERTWLEFKSIKMGELDFMTA